MFERQFFLSALSLSRGLATVGLCLFAFGSFAGEIDFTRDVRPILAESCVLCHGPDEAKGGLRLTDRKVATGTLKSGERGIVPGDADSSEVIRRVLSSDPDDLMPPPDEGERLSAEQIAILRQWIDEGAEWPVHWAYRPLSVSAPGVVNDIPLARNEIDRFVLAQLEGQGIVASPEADRYTLIKRLSYDLIGLPPGVSEVDEFVNDDSLHAYERVVDRLLASPHFGERWGRHWLDKARYADSDGYEKDRNRMNAWRYRDWVIKAINDDLPFDRFTIDQLAGDLANPESEDALLATAFNRQTLTNTEGGTDQEQWRVAAVMDRTETLGAVWLGLTVGCARCHNHKYDQISQKEYYQLFAYFNNGDETNMDVPRSELVVAKYDRDKAAHDAKAKSLQGEINTLAKRLAPDRMEWEREFARELESKTDALAFHDLEISSVASTGGISFDKQQDGSYRAKGANPDKALFTVKAKSSIKDVTAFRLEAIADDVLPKKGPGRAKGNFVLSHFEIRAGKGAKLTSKQAVKLIDASEDYNQKKFPAINALNKSAKSGWGVGGGVGKSHYAVFRLEKALSFEGEYHLQFSLDQQFGKKHTLGRFRITAVTGDPSGIVPRELRLALKKDIRSAEEERIVAARFYQLESRDMRALEKDMAALKKTAPASPLMKVRVISQRTKDARVSHILRRGEFKQPLGEVIPGTLSSLPSPALRNPENGDPKNGDRLDMARWLVNGENPLTPRVTVNHIWGILFGEGIVRTINDFGVRGDRPTHPDLLDWLARRFIDLDWSRKALIKTIVMSATYRQSSKHRPELADIDPTNRLLYRQNRFRVEAEILRDLSLAVSGLLSREIGGPSVFPPMPPDAAAVNYNSAFKWKTSENGNQHRRGIYTFFKRTAPHPNLTTFDCPDSNVTCVKRTRSNTPIGALASLNNTVYVEAAQAFGGRLLRREFASDRERMEHAFRACVARPPVVAETDRLMTVLAAGLDWYGSHEEEARKIAGAQASLDCGPVAEYAAWIATVRVLLNLDEFITRE